MKTMTVGPMAFSDRDPQIIGDCLVNVRASLPPGLAKKDHLPPGLERQLQRNRTLPPQDCRSGCSPCLTPVPLACRDC